MKNSKVALFVSQIIEKVEKIVGIVFAILFILMVFTSNNSPGDTVMFLIMAALSVLLFLAGRKRTKMRLEFVKYVAVLSEDPSGSLDNLAAVTNTSVDVVRKNVKYMIKKRFFNSAVLNEAENRIYLPSIAQKATQQTSTQNGTETQPEEYEVRICPCCGGKNKVKKGTVGECDFCGMPLS